MPALLRRPRCRVAGGRLNTLAALYELRNLFGRGNELLFAELAVTVAVANANEAADRLLQRFGRLLAIELAVPVFIELREELPGLFLVANFGDRNQLLFEAVKGRAL